MDDRVRDLRERLHQLILDDVRQAVRFVERRIGGEPDVQVEERVVVSAARTDPMAAEDVALAQHMFAAGKRTELILGDDDLTTRMYTSLAEIMAGWRKNVFAGGREAMPWGRMGQLIFPALLLITPVLTVLPPIALTAALLIGGPPWLLLGAIIAVVAELATWAAVYRWMRAPAGYALLFPLGAVVFAVIALQAIARGSRVEWKGRAYVTTSRAPRTSR